MYDIILYETIRSMELAFGYKFNKEEIRNIVRSYNALMPSSKL